LFSKAYTRSKKETGINLVVVGSLYFPFYNQILV